ncbi:hypothetical protein DS843_00095 [Roseomonas genomospecies 6]|uniref:Uncharacterized protein n=1 Tax=Roseomonas genomospecies 6 TaxID=214106 RepID=A0A9W7NNJ1_9PROT|nr:hypothetical protein DS843_00095 [Roseomonas genomospecies 6]
MLPSLCIPAGLMAALILLYVRYGISQQCCIAKYPVAADAKVNSRSLFMPEHRPFAYIDKRVTAMVVATGGLSLPRCGSG